MILLFVNGSDKVVKSIATLSVQVSAAFSLQAKFDKKFVVANYSVMASVL
jgi:hypothetical protein